MGEKDKIFYKCHTTVSQSLYCPLYLPGNLEKDLEGSLTKLADNIKLEEIVTTLNDFIKILGKILKLEN